MFDNLKARWAATCTKWGTIFKRVLSRFLLVAAGAQYAVEQAGLLPDGFVPQSLKYVLGALALISFLYGGFTKAEAKEEPPK